MIKIYKILPAAIENEFFKQFDFDQTNYISVDVEAQAYELLIQVKKENPYAISSSISSSISAMPSFYIDDNNLRTKLKDFEKKLNKSKLEAKQQEINDKLGKSQKDLETLQKEAKKLKLDEMFFNNILSFGNEKIYLQDVTNTYYISQALQQLDLKGLKSFMSSVDEFIKNN